MTECERIVLENTVSRSFLEEETRCDYEISQKMKKVWAIELDLLHRFNTLCEEFDLRYWVGFGTLLGTVRHHGFIPWDDDMDVWMPREDYDKLLAMDVRLEAPYFLQTTLNDIDYYSSFARLRNSNTTGILVSKKNKCNNGIYIDIYPLDGLNSNKLQQFLRSKYIRMLNVAAHAYTFNINPSVITRAIHGILHLPFIPYDYKKVYKEVNRLASKIKWDETENIGMVVFAPYAHNHNMFDKADFTDTIWMDFENTAVPVPKGFNNILKTIYGDYMSFPPLEKRGTWHAFTFDPDEAYYNYKN